MDNIYCDLCDEYHSIFNLLNSWNVYNIPNTIRGYKVDIQECPNCGSDITFGNYLILDEDEFLNNICTFISEKILNSEVGECQYCNVDKIIFTQKYGDVEDLTTIGELIDEFEIPEIKDRIIEQMVCTSCGESLDEDSPYVTSNEVESWYQESVEIVVNTLDITEEDGHEFIDYMLSNPMLSIEHDIGKKVYEKIKAHDIPGITTIKAGEKLFRGRKRNRIEPMVPYIPQELWNPPRGRTGQGRYNPPGISSLYLASNKEVIAKELKLNEEEIIDIGEFLILEDLLVWDTRELDIDIFNSIPSLNNQDVLRKEYVFPNFLAQCLMANQFKGIIYKSTRGEGDNYCFFNFKPHKEFIIESIFQYQPSPIQQTVGSMGKLPF
ncbi:RES family NAD+ phosphorylase [Alkalihalophilus pseudofirmus]|uniref:RES family NAD+ phosphorylase n=1 Tax=Alkalihalophilus pseudofirmus TaxID=79885 RepID=A0AAJ2NQ36_ALKPS|nr:RES family NAD+ phosphorylase [Alkalihalophilus pseudofirmus]MDV2886372.1 RES family NAD+ phosphorylase [Alkalihalophilus pseudofirmus]